MLRCVLVFCWLSCSLAVQSQIASGSKLVSNIKTFDINGKEVDVFKDLAEGKFVVFDVFATWCGPCWTFHQSGVLKELYKKHGPNGSNTLSIYGIEADNRTPLNHLFSAISATSTTPSSLGNWTEGVEYGIINNHSFNTLLKISFFPTLYLIRPDRTVLLVPYTMRQQLPIWSSIIEGNKSNGVIFSESSIENKVFCKSAKLPEAPVLNVGNEPITDIEIEIVKNNTQSTKKKFTFSPPVPVFSPFNITPEEDDITETTFFNISLLSASGVPITKSTASSLIAYLIKPVVKQKKFFMTFTTDFYPGEISWVLTDNKNRELKSVSYVRGSQDQRGGGGPDANRKFTYEIILENNDIECLTVTVKDTYGDGMIYGKSTDPIPGIEFFDAENRLIKPRITSDYIFGRVQGGIEAYTYSYLSVAQVSDVDHVVSDNGLKMYPNPVENRLYFGSDDTLDNLNVTISDVSGKIVFEAIITDQAVDVTSLSTGLYFMNVLTPKGRITGKFVKI
jgi:thiol-disulfide isomerase/thioredoxin